MRRTGDSFIILAAMQSSDPASEWLRLSQHYREMNDDELLAVGQQISELTDAAKQALANELSRRGLKIPAPEPPPFPKSEPTRNSAEPRKDALVEIRTVWSLPDALKVQKLMDKAAVPFFLGPERATRVDPAVMNFVDGLSVQVMRMCVPMAQQALQEYTPSDEPRQEVSEHPVRCPRCHSAEVIFLRLTTPPGSTPRDASTKFDWACDSCGYKWEDDGVVEKE